jgi:hypothetical protein
VSPKNPAAGKRRIERSLALLIESAFDPKFDSAEKPRFTANHLA